MKNSEEQKALFMEKLCEEFKGFVLDAMSDQMFVDLESVNQEEDHLRVLEAAMETFLSIKGEHE